VRYGINQLTKKHDRAWRPSVENVRGISREINLAATFQKWVPARLRSFEVEQNPALRGPHERRRAGLSVFWSLVDDAGYNENFVLVVT
jgi:hypothetical protein